MCLALLGPSSPIVGDVRIVALALLIAVVGVACDVSEPKTLAYQYAVRGTGEEVKVTYFVPGAGLVGSTVALPWASEELRGNEMTPIRIEVDGPSGSEVKCVVRYRRIDGSYGGNGSGALSQYASAASEDRTVCSLDQDRIIV